MRYIILCLLLASCATQARYRALLNTWKGESVDRLVMSWGPPNKSFVLSNGFTVYEYSWASTQAYFIPGNAAAHTQGFAGTTHSWCNTMFTVSPSGVIWEISYRGNRCTAR